MKFEQAAGGTSTAGGVEFTHPELLFLIEKKIKDTLEEAKKHDNKKLILDEKTVLLRKTDLTNLKGLELDKLQQNSFIRVGDFFYRQVVSSAPFPSLVKCTALGFFDISNNAFSGLMPDALFEPFADKMRLFSIHVNQIEGSIPASIKRCKCLKNATMQSNQLSGAIPPLPNCLSKLDAGSNKLSGQLPVLPKNLKKLVVPENQLSGPTEAAFKHHDLSAPGALGSRWVEVGSRPAKGTEITNAALASALEKYVGSRDMPMCCFREDEIRKFFSKDQILETDLKQNSFIRVGNTFFEQAAGGTLLEKVDVSKQSADKLLLDPLLLDLNGKDIWWAPGNDPSKPEKFKVLQGPI